MMKRKRKPDNNFSFEQALGMISFKMQHESELVHTEKWQGVDISSRPEMATHELRHVFLEVPLPNEDLAYYRNVIKPSIPWADDHFEERVCGQPINPGVQWAKWPWGHSAKSFLDKDGKFNHNYMERYWPKEAGAVVGATQAAEEYVKIRDAQGTPDFCNDGIYHPYGDLMDVVRQLAREPMTRQAILPVFFPEDTGAVHGGRVPCSIYYQFIMRDGKMDVVYAIRSCDFVRHLRDDIYLTVRLLLWVLNRLRAPVFSGDNRVTDQRIMWDRVRPGKFVMMITSLHCFRNDYIKVWGQS